MLWAWLACQQILYARQATQACNIASNKACLQLFAQERKRAELLDRMLMMFPPRLHRWQLARCALMLLRSPCDEGCCMHPGPAHHVGADMRSSEVLALCSDCLPCCQQLSGRAKAHQITSGMLDRFPEPAAWHAARMAFTRTAAVWSMVGHIVGLGDRHGENLLLDASTGDLVQVDFSCLFDRVPPTSLHTSYAALGALHLACL